MNGGADPSRLQTFAKRHCGNLDESWHIVIKECGQKINKTAACSGCKSAGPWFEPWSGYQISKEGQPNRWPFFSFLEAAFEPMAKAYINSKI